MLAAWAPGGSPAAAKWLGPAGWRNPTHSGDYRAAIPGAMASGTTGQAGASVGRPMTKTTWRANRYDTSDPILPVRSCGRAGGRFRPCRNDAVIGHVGAE